MDTARSLLCYNDILEPRRQELSNFLWVSRKLDTLVAFKQSIKPKASTHKKETLASRRIQELIEKTSADSGDSKIAIEQQIRLILDEIGFNKQLKIIRWLGLVLTKICQKVNTGIYVNEDSVLRLKSKLGNCPVIFAPSHRSYADFILMSYICFTYDLEIPAIAAGMDFHGMWGMGSMLRDTGAFFMRRSYNDDPLYWATFKQYVHQLVTRGELPIEFFIEGTRSRSCKSLAPKYGLLSMMLKAYFTGEVPDILIVPINISYDRVLEEKLFAFELLGLPKPKETTSGFFKSLSIVKEHYGKIYVDFTKPISVKEYFGHKTNHSLQLQPIHQHTLNEHERSLITDLAYEIVLKQQKHAVLTAFNVAAVLIVANSLLSNKHHLIIKQFETDIVWLTSVLVQLGALVAIDTNFFMDDILSVHKDLIRLNDDSTMVEQCRHPIVLDEIDPKRMKGHLLSNCTMTRAVPDVLLQLYVNPCMHYLVDCCLVSVLLRSFANGLTRDHLFGHFRFLRSLLAYEFVFYKKREQLEFEVALHKLESLQVIESTLNSLLVLGPNEKLLQLFTNMMNPFISAYHCVCRILQNIPVSMSIEHSNIIIEAQKQLEVAVNQTETALSSYCLNLDSLGICLQNLSDFGALHRRRMDGKIKYTVCPEQLNVVSDKLEQYTSKCFRHFTNTVTSNSSHFSAKL